MEIVSKEVDIMFEKIINIFFGVDILDIYVTPTLTQITTKDNDRRTADLLYNDVVKFAHDNGYNTDIFDSLTPLFGGLYNDTDGFVHDITLYDDNLKAVAHIEIYFH